MKKVLLFSVLLLLIGVSDIAMAQRKAPPPKGSEQTSPDYTKPKDIAAPKSDKPTNAPKGGIKSNTGSATAPKPGKGSVPMVPDYKKPKTIPTSTSGKPTNAPKGDIKGATNTTPKTPPPPRGNSVINTKGQQGPKPSKGSDQMVPDYKKPKSSPINTPGKGVKGDPAPKPTGGVKPPPTKPNPKPTPTKPTVEVKNGSTNSKQIVPDYKAAAKKPK